MFLLAKFLLHDRKVMTGTLKCLIEGGGGINEGGWEILQNLLNGVVGINGGDWEILENLTAGVM